MRPNAFLMSALLACTVASLASNSSAEVSGGRPDIADASRQGLAAMDLDIAFSSIGPTGPGCVTGVRSGDGRPRVAAYGMADLEHADPLTPASVFESGSLAKQFTAAAILSLAQDGRLTLDDDIRLYLPEMPDYGAQITIRHLLNHTSGLREQWSLMALAGAPPGVRVHSQAMILDLASRQKGLNFAPGAEYLYTNTNYVLAATIVARVSGESLQQFTDRRLFAPLGMTQTRWREDYRTVTPGRATAYVPDDEGGFVASMPFTNVYGNGGLLTTVEDLLRWNAFLDHPGELPGGPDLVKSLETPGQLNDGTVLDYGLGLEISLKNGQRLVAHSGSTGGYKTWLGRYPKAGVSVALLCNNGGIDPIAVGEALADRVLVLEGWGVDAVAPRPDARRKPMPLPADLVAYTGLFRNPVTGDLLRVAVVDGEMTLIQRGNHVLIPLAQNRFSLAEGGEVRFAAPKSAPVELFLPSGLSKARYVAVQAANPDPGVLREYVGVYYSAELDTRITVVLEGDALIMRQAFAMEWPLTPSFADGFSMPVRGTTSVQFTRSTNGGISGFGAWATGARDIRFVKQ